MIIHWFEKVFIETLKHNHVDLKNLIGLKNFSNLKTHMIIECFG